MFHHKKDDDTIKREVSAEMNEAVKEDATLAACQKRCAEYLSGWQRAQADYQNLVKETEAKRKEWLAFAGMEILHGVLPVYDHLKLALTHIPSEQKKLDWVIGIEHIKNQMKKFLESQGIEEIQTIGQKFDPSMHEAVEHENTENTKTQPVNVQNGLLQPAEGGSAYGGETQKHENAGTQNELIKKEVRAGYKLNGKVIQAAKVVV